MLGALALSECGAQQGCLRGVPGSHKWGILKHEESDDPKSILARGQYITDPFDESKAVDFALAPGEMVMFDNSLVHGSGDQPRPRPAVPPAGRDAADVGRARRACRQSAMLLRGVDTYGNFDDEPRPDAEWSPSALANWTRVVDARAKLIFEDSKIAPSEAYGGRARRHRRRRGNAYRWASLHNVFLDRLITGFAIGTVN